MAQMKPPTIDSLPKTFRTEDGELILNKQGEPANWIEHVVSLYKEGAGDEEAMRALRITRRSFGDLMKDDELFFGVIEHGRLCRQAWYLEQGRKNIFNKQFNTPLWYHQMKNLFGWADKQDQTIGEREIDNLSKAEVDVLFAGLEADLERRLEKKLKIS